jgi:hypothetical protein
MKRSMMGVLADGDVERGLDLADPVTKKNRRRSRCG